jgi:DNA-binding transcriptional regulator LsrR (DeoR family)
MSTKKKEWPPEVVFRLAELLFAQGDSIKAESIVKQVNEELKPASPLNRQSLIPALCAAKRLGFVRLDPPLENDLSDRIRAKYGCRRDTVHVVDYSRQEGNEWVSAKAADLATGLVKDLAASTGAPVTIGLGPGRATRDFAEHLSQRMRKADRFPKVNLVAISAGGPAEFPEHSSSSFFNLFPREGVEKRIGLFAGTLIHSRDSADIKLRAGVKEAFAIKPDIRLVVTSMGDIEDEHDLFRIFLERSDPRALRDLRHRGCVGNVQYRPYSAKGPIDEGPTDMLRAVTLFELPELVKMAGGRDREIILIARRCGACGRNRARSLRPILENPELRVFSHLVVDSPTARELLD